MNLGRFRVSMNKAEEILTEKDDKTYSNGGYLGVCEVLGWSRTLNNEEMYDDFCKIFAPKTPSHSGYWLGDLTESNVPKRMYYLRMFEQIAISEKLYKNY